MCFLIPIDHTEINSAKTRAIRMACLLSSQNKWVKLHSIEIESDSLNAVKWCNDPGSRPWNQAFNLNLINEVKNEWGDFIIRYRNRSMNHVADSLAKSGLSRGTPLVAWL